ncbi:beta strand repeat-containing protein [Candidatus Odyssella thessalonicensis]|uniref:beta strand repeat-containing protein n=1 Tax=Candidatus Odyssella thessalonicensis TaxID=84647 RepID=UPI000225AEB9|nr:autotransporter-associated beta strand repeat-containing protein [Candidatus Odyssella thessalonicensis]
MTGNATLDNGGYTGYFSNPITSAYTVTFQGTGTTVIGGANTPSSTTIAAGTLALNTGASLANSISIANGATYDISNGAANPSLSSINAVAGSSIELGNQNLSLGSGTVAGNLLDGGLSTLTGASVTKTGPGTLTLSGVNDYSGGTSLNAGIIAIGNPSALGTSSVTFGGGGLQLAGAYTVANPLVLAAAQPSGLDLNNYDGTFTGVISAGGNTFSVTNSGGVAKTLTLTGVNTYSGTTSIGSKVVLALNNNGTIGTSALSFADNTAIFDISGISASSLTMGSLNSAQGQISLGAKTLSLGSNSATAFGGTIQDGGVAGGTGGSLSKTGSGILTLSGNNNYSGGTSVNAGTIAIGHANALGTSSVTLGGGGLQLAGAYTVANPLVLAAAQPSGLDLNNYDGTFTGIISGGGDTLRVVPPLPLELCKSVTMARREM